MRRLLARNFWWVFGGDVWRANGVKLNLIYAVGFKRRKTVIGYCWQRLSGRFGVGKPQALIAVTISVRIALQSFQSNLENCRDFRHNISHYPPLKQALTSQLLTIFHSGRRSEQSTKRAKQPRKRAELLNIKAVIQLAYRRDSTYGSYL